MNNMPSITTTSENATKTTSIAPIITGACTVAFCIAFFSATNGIQIEFPQQSLCDIHTVSTDTAKWKMYNSRNINLYLDGVSTMNANLLHSYQKISEIRCLEDNWNGNGAPKFSSQLLDSVLSIVEKLTRQPSIFPTARDSIQLEYENDIGDYLEFEVFEGGRLKKFFYGHDGKMITEDIPIETIYEVVDNFYGFKI